jgi:hypothetical protein
MSYCRFENTLNDLQDCSENMEGIDLSESEQKARKQMIALCIDIACDFGSEIDRPCEGV